MRNPGVSLAVDFSGPWTANVIRMQQRPPAAGSGAAAAAAAVLWMMLYNCLKTKVSRKDEVLIPVVSQ